MPTVTSYIYRYDRFQGWFGLCDIWFAFQAELQLVSLSVLQNLHSILICHVVKIYSGTKDLITCTKKKIKR